MKRYPIGKKSLINEQSGFSLYELMVVIAIIAILAAIAVPNVVAWRNNSQFSSAVRQVKSTIEGIRMAAIRTNMPALLFFNGTDTFTTQTRSIIAGAAVVNPPVNHRLPPGVSVDANNDQQLTFNNRGMATPRTVTVQNTNGLSSDIIVAITGSSRVQ